MKRFTLAVELIDDVLFARSSATTGARESLDHIPGSALLGAAASALYAQFDAATAWQVFHSGDVRFGAAAPITDDGELCAPAPLSFHYLKDKGRPPASGGDGTDIFNRAAPRSVELRQFEQLRGLWFGPRFRFVSPRRRSATRTAIDPVSGRAATGQLFSYEALAAGQRFAGTLEIDDAVDHEVVTRIREALSGTVRLGRSKASEYGRARIAIGEGDAYETWRAEAARGAGDLAILCLSDFAPSDPARIDAAEFGLAAGDLDWGRSFVRTRVFAPFNAALRACEPDRVVFERGSVLLFENARHEGDAIFYGGRFREAGFGQIWVDPAWLRTEHPSSPPEARISFVPENRSIVALPQALAIAVRASAELLEFRASTVSAQGAHVAWAQEKALDLGRLYDAAAAYAGGVAGAVGPGSSQWGRVKDAAEKATTIEDLRVRLFGDKGVCRRIQKGEARADAEWSAGAQRTAGDAKTLVFESFADWMEKRLDEGKSIEAMRQLARECGRIAQNYRRREAIGA